MDLKDYEKATELFEKVGEIKDILLKIRLATAANKMTYYLSSGPSLSIEIPEELTKDFLSTLNNYYTGLSDAYMDKIKKL